MEKAEIRKLNKQKRNAMSASEVKEKSFAIARLILQSELYKAAKTLMLYMPLGNEAGTSLIMKNALEDGKSVVLPVTDKESKITPYYADENSLFCIGEYSVQEPQNTQAADPNDINVVIVPGIAFDGFGNRIGFGKGCYDRFLRDISAVKIGICYDFQAECEIPADPFDVKMDYVVTEKGIRQV